MRTHLRVDFQVLVEGRRVGRLQRTGPCSLVLPALGAQPAHPAATLDIVVEAVGRSNEGWRWDVKGLPSSDVFLDGAQQAQVPFHG